MPEPDLEELWRSFVSPPDDARPRVWWHWMDGNVDLEGIRLDLEWLHRVGVRGVQQFDGGMGTPLVVPEPVLPGSERWREAIRFAARTAERLGIELTVATSAGWSAAGAPWVEPADAMQKVVWSQTVVEGGAPRLKVVLPPLPDVAGAYQDSGVGNGDSRRFALDAVLLAVPADPAHEVLRPAAVTSSAPITDWAPLVDGGYADAVALPRDPMGESSAWIEQAFEVPTRVSAVTVGLPGPTGFGAAPAATAVLEASDDGITYRPVAVLPVSTVPVRTAAFDPVTARRFRLVLSGASTASALPSMAEGVRRPPVLRTVAEFLVSEFALVAGGRVDAAEVKAGFGVVPDYFALPIGPSEAAIDSDQVLDLTPLLDEAGVLRWDAPEGRWRILRLGASLTGHTNGPASPEATGLEVDKLDAGKVRRYLERHLAGFDEALAGAALHGLLSDSIESGPQNWTDRFVERFRALRGYDPTPWLPALAGFVVRDAAATDGFLFDHRRTIADLVASEYYGTVAAVAHERGLTYYAEALEDHRPQLGGDLAMRAAADVPMGAMWAFDPGSDPAPTYVADLKGASSVAHVHGKAYTGAESMTAFHRPWSYTPKVLKHLADLQLSLGVTRFCIHTSPHQPSQVPPPGIGLAPFLGQAFTRLETWADLAGPWIDYLARCSWLLNQGEPAVDVAVLIGEEGPVTALFGDVLDRSVPPGFDFDYVDLEALEQRMRVEDGDLVAAGARYRLLYLGGSGDRLTVRALRRLLELADAGATIVGKRPVASPSLADDGAAADDEWHALCDRLWGTPAAGPGPVLPTSDLAGDLRMLGHEPQVRIEGAEVRTIARILPGIGRVTFVSNPQPIEIEAVLVAPGVESLAVWDPVRLRRQLLEERSPGRCVLQLPPLGSAFVLTDGAVDPAPEARSDVPVTGDWTLEVPGIGKVDLPNGPAHWTGVGPAFLGHSGTATYRTVLEIDDGTAGSTALLDLGEVGDLARVRVNGSDCGIAWTAPFHVEVTGALVPGRNSIEVEVTNAWMNRLIAEASAPSDELFAPDVAVYEPDAPVRPAGLAGPVTLRVMQRRA